MCRVVRVPVLRKFFLCNWVVSATKLPNQVTGLRFQSILMVIEVPETRCSHPGECVHYGDLSDGLPEQVPKLPDN